MISFICKCLYCILLVGIKNLRTPSRQVFTPLPLPSKSFPIHYCTMVSYSLRTDSVVKYFHKELKPAIAGVSARKLTRVHWISPLQSRTQLCRSRLYFYLFSWQIVGAGIPLSMSMQAFVQMHARNVCCSLLIRRSYRIS
jgi:hypothetical protein